MLHRYTPPWSLNPRNSPRFFKGSHNTLWERTQLSPSFMIVPWLSRFARLSLHPFCNPQLPRGATVSRHDHETSRCFTGWPASVGRRRVAGVQRRSALFRVSWWVQRWMEDQLLMKSHLWYVNQPQAISISMINQILRTIIHNLYSIIYKYHM